MKTLTEISADLNQQVVANVNGKEVTRAELTAAFNRVANPANWKLPIDCVVDVADDFEIAVIQESVKFFAGCRARINYAGKQTRFAVKADGYYKAVGA